MLCANSCQVNAKWAKERAADEESVDDAHSAVGSIES